MSGGIDSTACAHFLLAQGLDVRGLFIDYGQAAARNEIAAATAIASALSIPLHTFIVSGADPYAGGELLGRNAFLIFTALFLGRCHSGLLALGIHDGTPYYDCSAVFLNAAEGLIAEHTAGRASLATPFRTWQKHDIVAYAISARLPLHLTYSCELGLEPPCGDCLSCHDRSTLAC